MPWFKVFLFLHELRRKQKEDHTGNRFLKKNSNSESKLPSRYLPWRESYKWELTVKIMPNSESLGMSNETTEKVPGMVVGSVKYPADEAILILHHSPAHFIHIL